MIKIDRPNEEERIMARYGLVLFAGIIAMIAFAFVFPDSILTLIEVLIALVFAGLFWFAFAPLEDERD